MAFGHEQKLLIAVAHTIRGTVDRDWPEFERAFAPIWRLPGPASHPLPRVPNWTRRWVGLTARVDRLTDLLANNGDVEPIPRRLRAEEAKLRELRERRDALVAPKRSTPPPSSAHRVRVHFEDVAGTLLANPEGEREALAAAFSGITLRPVARNYRLELEMATAASVARAAVEGLL